MSQLNIQLLGSPRIELDGAPVAVDTRKAIALLAYLAVTRRPHRRSSLALLFWPDSDQGRARTALRRTLAALNKGIGKRWLQADRNTIGLNLELEADGGLHIDVQRFQRLHRLARAGGFPGPEACREVVEPLTEAAELYRDDFMDGFSLSDSPGFDEWQFFQQEQLRQEIIDVLQRLVACRRHLGETTTAVENARRWLAIDRLSESAHRTLMEIYAAAGQRSAALRQYAECERLLAEELDVAPSPETTAVYERVMAGDFQTAPAMAGTVAGALPPSPPPAPEPPRQRHNLPLLSTSFLGREQEQSHINALLDQENCRLVTVVGPGGIGKTRLVLELGHRRVERHAHGVFFVPLAPLALDDPLVPTFAEALGLTFSGQQGVVSPRDQLIDYLRAKEMLLIVDNFEHLIDSARLLADILRQAPGVKMLVTSQERLNLREEWLVEIHGLSCPSGTTPVEVARSSAAQLFLERATQVQGGFQMTGTEAPHVARICRLVGGLPLGIELASTWVRMLSCAEIAQQIESNIDFLATTLRDVPDRHRSLRAVFEHSWHIMDEAEREVFRRLAIFRGSFQAAAVTAVTEAPLPTLLALADKSLVRHVGDHRFELPEVLALFARQKFEEAPVADVEARHAVYHLGLLGQYEMDLQGEHQKAALDVIRQEVGNIRQAWRLAVARGEWEALGDALHAFFLFYEMQAWYEEGAAMCRHAAAALTDGDAGNKEALLVGRLRSIEGAFFVRLARYEKGRALLDDALRRLRPLEAQGPVAFCLYSLGIAAEASGAHEEAFALQSESLAFYEAIGDRWGMAHSLNGLGNVSVMRQERQAALDYYEQSLALRRELGDRRGVALCYHNLGNIRQAMNDTDAARDFYGRSIRIKRDLGDPRGIGYSLNNLGYMLLLQGELSEAESALMESLDLLQEVGDRRGSAYATMNLGNIAFTRGDYEAARERYGDCWSIFAAIGDRVGIAYALEDLGNTALGLDDLATAERRYLGALAAAREVNLAPVLRDAILGLALVRQRQGATDEAERWAALIRTELRLTADAVARLAALDEALAADDAAREAAEAWAAERTVTDVIDELLRPR